MKNNNAIELTRLREITTPEGKTVLYGQFGFAGGRLQITERDEPDEFGCTWTVQVLPPKKYRPGLAKQAKATGPENRSATGELLAYYSGMETTGEEL